MVDLATVNKWGDFVDVLAGNLESMKRRDHVRLQGTWHRYQEII